MAYEDRPFGVGAYPYQQLIGGKCFRIMPIEHCRKRLADQTQDFLFLLCPGRLGSIVREEDGLALSSRNARLSAVEREYALNISQTLFKSCTFAKSHPVAETQKFVEDAIAAAPGLRLEYFEIVDGTTLQKITDWEDTDYAVGCITVFCGEVRLIDNIKYKG